MWRYLIALFLISNAITAQAGAFDHTTWNSLLQENVRAFRDGQVTQVDYRGMQEDRERLTDYLSSLERVEKPQFDSWPKNEQLAFLINAYNAWTVELVLSAYPDIESIRDLGSFFRSPWQKPFIPLLGDTRSLDDIEHQLIRGSDRFRDPRVHFALNCASIGCPALRADAYQSGNLNSQLDQAAMLFLSDKQRNRYRDGQLEVSSIFKWYREDFERGWQGISSLPQFFAQFSDALGMNKQDVQRLNNRQIDIHFLDYDWRLNQAIE